MDEKLITQAPKLDGIFQESDRKFYVKRTIPTSAELDLLHASLPDLILKYQTIIRASNTLLLLLSERESQLLPNARSPPSVHSVEDSDVYHEYLKASDPAEDLTLPWPPTPDRINAKLSRDLINLARDFYRSGEMGEANLESQIWKRSMMSEQNTAAARSRLKKLSGNRSIKNPIYARVSVATVGKRVEGEEHIRSSETADQDGDSERSLCDGLKADEGAAPGWRSGADLEEELVDDWRKIEGFAEGGAAVELPWFMPDYDEPYKASNFKFSDPLIIDHIVNRRWLEATESFLQWLRGL